MMHEDAQERILENVNKNAVTKIKTEIREMLANCITSFQQIELDNKYEDYMINGVPLSISRRLLLIKFTYDFAFDGYKLFRMKDIRSIRCGEVEAYHDFVMREEGLFVDDGSSSNLDISSWKTVLDNFKSKEVIIDISTKDQAHSKKTFFVGLPIDIKDDFLLFKEMDVIGRWKAQNIKIPIDDITNISFGSRYLKMLFKYQRH